MDVIRNRFVYKWFRKLPYSSLIELHLVGPSGCVTLCGARNCECYNCGGELRWSWILMDHNGNFYDVFFSFHQIILFHCVDYETYDRSGCRKKI